MKKKLSDEKELIASRRSSVLSCASNGVAEVAINMTKSVVRVMVAVFETHYPMNEKATLASRPWLPRHPAAVYSRLQRLKSGYSL